jgi:hypothetical protein
MAEKTIHTPTVAAVDLKQSEHVHYFLTAEGAEPIFNHACEEKVLLKEKDFSGHPKMNYEWILRRGADEPVVNVGHDVKVIEMDKSPDNHGVAMSYFTAVSYTLVSEHHDQNHTKIKTLSDIEYGSNVPTAVDRASFVVFGV